MANHNNTPFFVSSPQPDLLSALSTTLAALVEQSVAQLLDQRFADLDQRLAAVETVLRAEGRLPLSAAPPPPQSQPRQSPLRSQHQQHQQQVQQQQQQVQQQVQQQQQAQQQAQHNQHVVAHHPQQQQQQQQPQQQAQFQVNPQQQAQQQQQQPSALTPNQGHPHAGHAHAHAHAHNGVDTDPVMALANATNPASLGPPVQQQQQQQQAAQQQLTAPPQQQAPPPNPAVLQSLQPIVPMEIPPEGYPISSRASMQLELDQYTIPRGYSMRMSGTRDMGKGKRKIRWICFRAGEARYSEASKAAGMPERASKKCNCPFKFECVETFRDSNMWVVHHHITPGTTTHNHPPSDPSEDPRSRKLPPQIAQEVDGWLRQGWQVSKIMTELKNRGFKNVLSRDLYNRRQQLKREDETPA